jgi:predicted transport protein
MSSPDDMMAAVTESMKERTGRTLDEWVEVVGRSGIDPLDQNAVRRWLKEEHGILQNTQWAIAFEAAERAGWKRPTVDEYVGSQYTGAKAVLRPIYDRIAELILAFGDDVRMEGRGTYVPFVRQRQFAAVAAATKNRIDVGLRFTDAPKSDRLAPAMSPGQATHKVSVMTVDEVDDELISLLRIAYNQNG